jgi:hypothetical protein
MNYKWIILLFILYIIVQIPISNVKLPIITTNNQITTMTMYRTLPSRIVDSKMYQKCHQEWMTKNHGLKMIWYDNQDCDRYMKTTNKRMQKCYESLNVGAYKADFFRLCILYENGGVYTDSHTTPYTSIKNMMKGCVRTEQKHMFISVLDPIWSGSGIHNGFVITTPKHPFIGGYINMIINNVEKKFYTDSDLGITGPVCFSRSINKFLKRKTNEPFQLGWNEYGDLSFYLYKFQWGPFQYIYKDNVVILSKKYCTIAYILEKLKSSSYEKKWKMRKVFL